VSMQSSSGRSRPHLGRRGSIVVVAIGLLAGGCSEFVLEGIISDRETARPLPYVAITQRHKSNWKELGKTDGRGRYWVLKETVTGGGNVRFSKDGYHPAEVTEGEFLTGQSFILVPATETDNL
jgi:hypothetical protein